MTSARCVMGCSDAMATGVSWVSWCLLQWLASQISSLKCSLYCEKCWKRGWRSDRERVSRRLCRPQAERDSIIWSAWVGEGCVPVSFQRETLAKCVWDRAESSDAHSHFTVKHIRQGREESRAVLVSTSMLYMSCTLEWSGDHEDLLYWFTLKLWFNYKQPLFWFFFLSFGNI